MDQRSEGVVQALTACVSPGEPKPRSRCGLSRAAAAPQPARWGVGMGWHSGIRKREGARGLLGRAGPACCSLGAVIWKADPAREALPFLGLVWPSVQDFLLHACLLVRSARPLGPLPPAQSPEMHGGGARRSCPGGRAVGRGGGQESVDGAPSTCVLEFLGQPRQRVLCRRKSTCKGPGERVLVTLRGETRGENTG